MCGSGGAPDAGSACVRRTCASVGANCGPVSDGCGGLLACGTCAFPNWWCRRAYFCGGGAITCPGGYLCPVRSRCETACMIASSLPGFLSRACRT